MSSTKKMKRRMYQVHAARRALYGKKKRILIVSPGGSGKTEIAAQVAVVVVKRKERVLVITHRRVIVTQIKKHLGKRVPVGIIMGDALTAPDATVQIASVDTLKNRELPDADVIIIDEAHRAVAATYAKILKHYKGKRIIGFTASPVRLDNVGLREVFDELYEAVKPSKIIGKYIMDAKIWSAKEEHLPELLGVRRDGNNDYATADLVKRVNKDGLVGGIVEHALLRLEGRTAICFCVSIEHSKHVVANFNAAGIKAAHVGSDMSEQAIKEVLRQLEFGEIQVVCCCFLLAEGWDLPTCEAVILARPTRSLSLYLQMCARAARMSKRSTLILDHACNTILHGSPTEDRVWTLDGEDRTSKDPAEPRAKVCLACQHINSGTSTTCSACGKALPMPETKAMINERKEFELAERTKKQMEADRERVLAFAKKKGLPATFTNAVLQDLAKRHA